MKRSSAIFLQGVIVLIGIVVLAVMIRFPLTEGAAVNKDLFSIYVNPFIMFGYLASIPFFVALYQGFKLLRFIGEHKAFSLSSVKTLRTIRYCAIILSASIVMAAVYIGVFHNKNDDPAGFIAMCFVTTFISIVIATSAAVFEKLLQNAVDIKSENDLTV